jgi:diguanylate cyclase (GGDEF)-like protein
MAGVLRKKDLFILTVMVLLFLAASAMSISSAVCLEGSARVINRVGMVRGEAERLIKQEMAHDGDDGLVSRLGVIINELTAGGGIGRGSDVFGGSMMEVERRWLVMKREIANARATGDYSRLYMLSESFYELTDRTSRLLESETERRISRSANYLICADAVFFLLFIYGLSGYVYSRVLARNARLLSETAYTDALTRLPNRTSCEREIERVIDLRPDDGVAVFIFDMNGIKSVNKKFGRGAGDKNIARFGGILLEEGSQFGFVGRYGGDAFLAILEHATEETALGFLTGINERVVAHNLLYMDDAERISFSVGYCVGSVSQLGLHEMINEADHRMYEKKRET